MFLGLYGPMYQFEAIDSSAPTLASSTPANGAVDVPKSSDLVFVMNEPVAVDGTSSGKLTLTPSSGAANIVVDRSAFSVAGDGVTVTVTLADLIPTQTVETYTVTMDAGILVDTATTPNAFAGIGGSELVFATDTTAPAIGSTDPSHMDTGVTSTGTTITVTFNEAIAVGVGNIMLSGTGAGTGTESVSRAIAVTDTTQVGVSGADLVITPLGGLDGGSQGIAYTVSIDTGAVTDGATVPNAFEQTDVYNFTVEDVSAPTVVTYTPSDGTVEVALTREFAVVFNEPIAAGAGSITLTGVTTSDVVTVAIGACSVDGSSLRFTPTLVSAIEEQQYTITIPAGFVEDANGVAFGGVALGVWTVTVVDAVAPSLVHRRPRNGATGVPLDTDLILRFDETVAVGTGSITFVGRRPDHHRRCDWRRGLRAWHCCSDRPCDEHGRCAWRERV